MAHINLNHLTPAQAESRADFDCEADWLHDETIQCECCCERFDDRADFAEPDDYGHAFAGWVCVDCAAEHYRLSRYAREAIRADQAWSDRL